MADKESGKMDCINEMAGRLKAALDTPAPACPERTKRLALTCLSLLKEKALAPSHVLRTERNGRSAIAMYFWDGRNYADLEFSDEGTVLLCLNLEREEGEKRSSDRSSGHWHAAAGRRDIEGYVVEPTESGLRTAIRLVLRHIKREKTLDSRRKRV